LEKNQCIRSPSIQAVPAAPPSNVVSATRRRESGGGEPADKRRRVFEWTDNRFIDLIRFVGRLYEKHREFVDTKDYIHLANAFIDAYGCIRGQYPRLSAVRLDAMLTEYCQLIKIWLVSPFFSMQE
jgi:hypothetical protein